MVAEVASSWNEILAELTRWCSILPEIRLESVISEGAMLFIPEHL